MRDVARRLVLPPRLAGNEDALALFILTSFDFDSGRSAADASQRIIQATHLSLAVLCDGGNSVELRLAGALAACRSLGQAMDLRALQAGPEDSFVVGALERLLVVTISDKQHTELRVAVVEALPKACDVLLLARPHLIDNVRLRRTTRSNDKVQRKNTGDLTEAGIQNKTPEPNLTEASAPMPGIHESGDAFKGEDCPGDGPSAAVDGPEPTLETVPSTVPSTARRRS
ncbi:hypothetical protein M885DRAFT_211194 [Pelagophyceae sp. CCMP2097]|nr:hypothetical protein M885DRAFT_211194 [Pelagophyceae sp. CCMP2097]